VKIIQILSIYLVGFRRPKKNISSFFQPFLAAFFSLVNFGNTPFPVSAIFEQNYRIFSCFKNFAFFHQVQCIFKLLRSLSAENHQILHSLPVFCFSWLETRFQSVNALWKKSDSRVSSWISGGGAKTRSKIRKTTIYKRKSTKISFGVWKFMLVLLKKRLLLVPASL